MRLRVESAKYERRQVITIGMQLTVEVVGEHTRELELDDGATYGDVVRAVGYSTQEAAVLVDGTPVPEDRSVDADRVTVLRLIKGGCTDDRDCPSSSVSYGRTKVLRHRS